jgi:hypothetical protein
VANKAARITRIELQGFRSFGQARQTLDLPEGIAVLWGGNSQGKTSFVEALEFLLTGQIVRRDLLASTKDEFTEALKNAHISPTHAVIVEACICCVDGKIRRLTRTLVDDYRRGAAAGCVSRLEIDGKSCSEGDITAVLGLRLSQPPLRAPVLAQHTLAYLFSVSPTERATYFRALLDTQDLEDFRAAVAALQPMLKAPTSSLLDDLAAVEAIPDLAAVAGRLRKSKTEADLRKHLSASTSALLISIGVTPAAVLSDQADQIDLELERRRAQTFPLDLFSRGSLIPWSGPPGTLATTITSFLAERDKVDAEARRLMELFQAALALPEHPTEHDPVDCPLCGATDTLTAERIIYIQSRVKATEAYTKAIDEFCVALHSLDGLLDGLFQATARSQPKFMRETAAARRAAGFTVLTITKLAMDVPTVRLWLDAMRPFWRSSQALKRCIAIARAVIQAAIADPDQWNGAQALDRSIIAVTNTYAHLEARLQAYEAPAKILGAALKVAVDQSTQTKGWESLVTIARDPTALWLAMTVAMTHAAKVKLLENALKEIDVGNGKVVDQKFTDLSAGVLKWWNLLRPNESTFFDAVARRSIKARRTIDLRVGLSARDDRSNPKFRDAIAVFSQSQLHCLGLSLFLARAVQEGAGFVILDDPVLTSDDDYRPNFVSSVIEGLLDAGLQIIICTQDHKSWKDIGTRWQHRGAIQYQIMRHDAVLGTEIRSQNDDLATMMAKAQPLIKSQDPVVRKDGAIRLREAIERFCKVILVKDKQSKGDSLASITDYDGQNFSSYGQNVMNLLTKNAAHPGKLKAAHTYATPGPHDDKPPSVGELSMAYGDLKTLKKDYLD